MLLLVAQGSALAQQGGAPPAGMQFGAAPPAQGEPELETRQFQDWMVRCNKQAATPACEMIQQRQDDQGQTVLAVAVGRVANTANPGMLIILPLGIWLPPGVVLKVDQGKEIPVRVEHCERRGCQVELLLEPDVLKLFKAGTQADVLFQIYDAQGDPQTVGVPFSLLGFTAALNEVMA